MPMAAFDREEQLLGEQLDAGEIAVEEYNHAIREMNLDYQALREEAAQQAYRDELHRW